MFNARKNRLELRRTIAAPILFLIVPTILLMLLNVRFGIFLCTMSAFRKEIAKILGLIKVFRLDFFRIGSLLLSFAIHDVCLISFIQEFSTLMALLDIFFYIGFTQVINFIGPAVPLVCLLVNF